MDNKIVTIRFNAAELRELEFVLKNSSRYFTYCVSALIKDMIHSEYLRLLDRSDKRM